MINKFLKCSVLLLSFLMINGLVHGQSETQEQERTDQPPSPEKLLKWHEVFTYEVRYSFFKLGEVKIEVVSDTLYNGNQSWHLRTVITSNSSIPFVGEEENHYNSIFKAEDKTLKVQEFWTDNVDEDEYRDSEYIFDRENQKVYAYELDQPRDTLALEEPASAGHILFFFSRLAAGSNTVVRMPIYLNREKKYLTATHTVKTEMREYDAFPDEVKTYYSWGETDVDGPFGFSGQFEAWYRADDLRVPVEARMKVWLGNAKVKLINYEKERRPQND